MKAALLIIDVQKESIKTESIASQPIKNAMKSIPEAIALFRKNGLPIIGVQYIKEEEQLIPGEDGFEILETMNYRATCRAGSWIATPKNRAASPAFFD
jgi:nicotinamidase-related amidase